MHPDQRNAAIPTDVSINFSTGTLFFLTACTLLTACDSADESPDLTCADWGYEEDNGPANWANLCSATCAGTSQSPVDIVVADVADEDLPEIEFGYHETDMELFNNGHTIEAAEETAQKTKSIGIIRKSYELLQFHFHSLSEHTIDGDHFPIEMHLVHRFSDADLAVIGVMIEQGAENSTLAPVWNRLPSDESTPVVDVEVNLETLLPEQVEYYRLDGSLTTPNGSDPSASCAEIVNWIIVKDALEMSAGQISAFQAIFDDNFRPTQPLNGRLVSG